MKRNVNIDTLRSPKLHQVFFRTRCWYLWLPIHLDCLVRTGKRPRFASTPHRFRTQQPSSKTPLHRETITMMSSTLKLEWPTVLWTFRIWIGKFTTLHAPSFSGCQTCGRHCSTSRSVRTDGTVIHCITARIAITLIIILLIKIWMACTVLYSTSGSSFLLWSGCKLQNRYSKCCYAWVGNFWKCWRIQVLHVPLLTFSSRFRFVKEDTM